VHFSAGVYTIGDTIIHNKTLVPATERLSRLYSGLTRSEGFLIVEG
jgi:hypothetical protein